MDKITVSLGKRSYPITIAAGLFENPTSFWPLKSGDNAMLVTNNTLSILYLAKVSKLLTKYGINIDQVILPDGEEYKTLTIMDKIFTELLKKFHDRNTTLIALGGGVIGDLTGFAAASYQRGVRLIQAPTTLLSQVDSAIGGKTGVNHIFGKNMIGVFYQPVSVVIDINCLHSLTVRELSSGLAEIIKYAISLDSVFFSWLEKNLDKLLQLDNQTITYCIRRCCELKAKIVEIDEREINGKRVLLNLGHTYGHAIETHIGYGTWSHGEAISAGMVMASCTAKHLGYLKPLEFKRIIKLLNRANLPIKGPDIMQPEDYIVHMMRDKKANSSNLCLVLPLSIGDAKLCKNISNNVIISAINDCQNYIN